MKKMLQDVKNFTTLVQLLRFRALHTPAALAFTYLREGVHEDKTYTYASLDQAARAIAVTLTRCDPPLAPGARVLLLYAHGVDFIAAFFGCLYAGKVPIPAPPPDGARFKRTFPRLQRIIEDADARLVLASDAICASAFASDEGHIAWLSTDSVDVALADAWHEAAVCGADLAYLQYTSGSTASPKGVMLTHACVIRNLALSKTAWHYGGDSVAVTWMPYFHDYGLVDGLLQPLYSGIPCYVLASLTFVKRPHRWLEAIDRYRGTHTQAPNFAYELCLDKITPAQRDGLDLRSLRVASNGAEPVREATYRRFVDYFAPCGFAPEAFFSAYGLAEATLLVSTKRFGEVMKICSADAATLEREQRFVPAPAGALARNVVSCGPALGDLQLAIVDPLTHRRVDAGAVGEIWVCDPCVAIGYWVNPQASAAVFGVRLADAPQAGGFLRTGDLGFLLEDELYVTGRLKDLIIIDGVNHYPQDIEWTVQQSHAELRADHCAAFSVEVDGAERLVVVAEASRPLGDWQPLFDAVRRAVAQTHELDLHALLVLRKGAILKTSSGKLQRQNCRGGYLDQSLAALAQWQRRPQPASVVVDAERIGEWLIAALARRLHIDAAAIDAQAPFASLGLTSRSGVGLVGDLELWLGREDLSPTLLWEYPNVATLCAHLAHGAGAAARLDPAPARRPDDGAVAIIGMACRLPGANNAEQFWHLLTSGTEALQALPDGRWQGSGMAVAEGVGPGRVTSLRGGFLDVVERFDAQLFGIGAREAQIMDPQQRMLLEVAWEAIEAAGLSADAMAGSDTGVFVGISTDDYSAWQFGDAQAISAYTGPAKALSIAANRISYQFDLLGPSMAIDTACSSSLVALHQASAALRRGECGMALAGGVNLILAPQMSIALSQAGMLAPDGRCKTFDAAADGYVRGEGCVLLLLKRLDDALRDGDTITAVIQGSAVNQDGRSNGLTAPNGLAQQRVVQRALDDARVRGADIGYVETHGTGTPLGDPIEVKALQAVLGAGRAADRPCALGALKANIGHLEAAAGVAGVLKAALCLRHGEIVGHPTLKQLNPLLALAGGALFVPTRRTEWLPGPRLAGVSAFGFGGTNAHLILAAAPPPAAAPAAGEAERELHVLTLCARDQQGLRDLAARWQGQLGSSAAAIADQCFSANTTRARLPQRLALIGAAAADFGGALDDWLAGRPGAWQQAGSGGRRAPRIAFLFAGQGSQYVGMGRALYRTEPGFRRDIDACDALLGESVGQSLVALLYAGQGDAQAEALLARTDLTQPVLFAFEYALARLWISWGITPVALLGHSIGEYAAAAVAGMFSLADGMRLVAARARLMHEAPGAGGMLAVLADEAQCRAALLGFQGKVVIAVYNGPSNHVLSGEQAALDLVAARLAADGVTVRPLTVSHAFHSPMMDAAAHNFSAVAAAVTFAPPAIPIFSNVTGQLGDAQLTTPAYWVEHLRNPVRFAQGLRAMRDAGIDAFIEIGPSATLLALGQQSIGDADLLWLPSLRRKLSDTRPMLEGLAALHLRGADVDWRRFDQHWPRNRVALPLYPFQGQRYWLPAVAVGAAPSQPGAPVLGKGVSSPLLDQTLFETRYDCATLPLLGEHRVFGQVVVPGAAHLALVLEAAASIVGDAPCALLDVIFAQALIISEPGSRRIQLAVARQGGAQGRPFKLISLAADSDQDWEEHATGRLMPLPAGAGATAALESALDTARAHCAHMASDDFYAQIWQPAIELGPQFRWVRQVWRGDQQVLARLALPEQAGAQDYRLHPGLIDSMLQVLTAGAENGAGEALVPFSFEQFSQLAPLQGSEAWSHIRLRPEQCTRDDVVSDVSLYRGDGTLVAQARGFRARRVASRNLIRAKSHPLESAVYAVRWDPAALVGASMLAPIQGACVLIGAQPEQLARIGGALAQHGVPCVQMCVSAHGLDGQRRLHIDDAAQTAHMLRALGPLSVVFYLTAAAGTAAAAGSSSTAGRLPDVAARFDLALQACTRVLHVAQALVGASTGVPRLVLMTTQAHEVELNTELNAAPRLDQAAIWGLARVVRLEHPELDCHCVDLSSTDLDADVALAALQAPGDLVLRSKRALAPTLARRPLAAQALPVARADVAYLVSGGLGALGLHLSEWLADQGARSLLLLGRSAPSAAALARIDALRRAGVDVQTHALDIADPQALAALLQERGGALPIGGVFHLAGVLDDAMLRQQQRARLGAVLASKLGGALNLHQHFQQHGLDHFVCFSSVAALTGSMGQGSYAAANAAVDGLMAARRAAGLPGVSIQWGPWADAGMAAKQSPRDRQRFADYGIEPIAPAAGMALLGQLLFNAANGGAVTAVLPVHWPTYLRQLYPVAIPPLYREVRPEDTLAAAAQPARGGALAGRLAAADAPQRRALLEQHLQDAVAGALGLGSAAPIGPRQRLFELGLDSLGAVELRNRLAASLQCTLRATLLFDYPTLAALANHIEHDVLGYARTGAQPDAIPVERDTLDQFSDDDLARLLAAELE